jgi:hypothetical protein
MRRVLIGVAVAASSLLMFGGVAQAGDPPAEPTVPPAFSPPVVAPVVDTDSAEAFAENYADDNARRFLRERRRNRVRVIDVNAACLQSPILETRFGCVFTLRALVINRQRGWDGWGHSSKARHSSKRGDDKRRHHRPRFRIRNFGCLGFLRIDGGPTVEPTAQLIDVECARVPRDDIEAPEPVM